jgi:hypothetical protein
MVRKIDPLAIQAITGEQARQTTFKPGIRMVGKLATLKIELTNEDNTTPDAYSKHLCQYYAGVSSVTESVKCHHHPKRAIRERELCCLCITYLQVISQFPG